MKYLIDSHAWIEYLQGTEKGRKAKRIIENKKNTILSSAASFAELYSWCVRSGNDIGTSFSQMRTHSTIVEIYSNLWIEAAHFKEQQRVLQKNFGLVDALLLAIQKSTGATIVTGDPHFKDMKKVVML